MRKALTIAAVAAAVAGSAVVAAPASAACTDPVLCNTTTLVAVTVTDTGLLSIAAAPVSIGTSVPLTAGAPSAAGLPVMGAPLTLTTVTDGRLNSTGWTVTGSSTAFTAADKADIPTGAVTFAVTAGTKLLGNPTLSFGGAAIANGGTFISAAGSSAGAVVGPNTVTYTPSISVEIPAGSSVGTTYTGTVTQSVS